METIREIMGKYNDHKATLEETNQALKAFGMFLDPHKNPGGGWTEAEMEQGFFPGEAARRVPELKEFETRIPELAGHTVIIKAKEGTFRVSYDADGYHAGSVRVTK